MKKYIISFFSAVFFICLAIGALAQEPAATDTGAVEIESVYTFDSVPDGTIVFHDFIIKNNKAVPLKITGVKPG